MNKRTLILEQAKLRLTKAQGTSKRNKQRTDMAHLVAARIIENDVYLYLDSKLLIVASLKSIKTIH